MNEQGTTLTDIKGHTTTTSDSWLFWAIRGGGGGTWGVVVDFTFNMHWAPQRFRNVVMAWSLTSHGKMGFFLSRIFETLKHATAKPNWEFYLLEIQVDSDHAMPGAVP